MASMVIGSLLGLIIGFLFAPIGMVAIGYWAGGFVIGAALGGMVGYNK